MLWWQLFKCQGRPAQGGFALFWKPEQRPPIQRRKSKREGRPLPQIQPTLFLGPRMKHGFWVR